MPRKTGAQLMGQSNGLEAMDKKFLRDRLGIFGNISQQQRAKIWLECRAKPDFFVFNFVRTIDEHNEAVPIDYFPDKDHLRQILHFIHTHPIVALPKTRQMMISWLMMAYCVWYARFWAHRLVIIQSKNKDDSNSFVFDKDWPNARCSAIEFYLPTFLRINVIANSGRLYYPNGSKIRAFPQGGHVFRQHVPSLIFMDEACFQPNFDEGLKAALPIARKGAKLIICSSAMAGTAFGSLIEDTDEEEAI